MIDLIEIPFGKRNLGLWDQFSLESRDEVVRVIQQHLGYRNIGISVCTYVNGDQILLFLYFDFDSKTDISLAWNDAKKTFNYFVEMNMSCLLSFSGNKGFHVFVEVEPKNYSSKQHKEVMRFYRDILGLKTLDEQTFDKTRLFRIPETWNPNGTWCRTLFWHDGEKLDLDEIITETYVDEKEEIETKKEIDEIRIYKKPCVEFLVHDKDFWMKERGKFEPSEAIRLSWAGIRIWAGWGIDEMIEEARGFGWEDFDSNYMREKKLPYLVDRKWTPHSCESLENLGYCLDGIDCRYKWKRKLNELGIGNGNGGI